MTYRSSYHSERFDLLDSDWEFLSVRDGEMTVRVDDVRIMDGEHQGEIIDTAVVTFRGFRMTWFHRLEEEGEIPLPWEEAVSLLMEDPYFVFSYWSDNRECELAAVGLKSFAMLFSFDSAEIGWDGFKERPTGTLIRK